MVVRVVGVMVVRVVGVVVVRLVGMMGVDSALDNEIAGGGGWQKQHCLDQENEAVALTAGQYNIITAPAGVSTIPTKETREGDG